MRLSTPRLVLRDFTLDDAAAASRYQRDPRYLEFYPDRADPGSEDAALIHRFIEWQHEVPRSRYQLAITLRPGELIGNVGLRRAEAGSAVAELGFELSPDHWGKGYATEAARALMAHGFGTFGLHRVHAHCIAENARSARVLERLGMKLEGRLRRHERMRNRWWDVLLFGILASEFREDSKRWAEALDEESKRIR